MLLNEMLAEQKIRAAQRRGELTNLAGSGKPLRLDDDSAIPVELRAGFRILKNSGYLPPELEKLKEIRQVENLLERLDGDEERIQAGRKLNFLKLQLAICNPQLSPVFDEQSYRNKVVDKLVSKD